MMPSSSSVHRHYDSHLARYYIWLFGGWEDNLARSRCFLADNNIAIGATGRAFDLGSGPGFFAIPLAEAGFAVTAVDTNAGLLHELASRAPAGVATVEGDMIAFLQRTTTQCDVCFCMGDTLAHLGSREYVSAFIDLVRRVLVPGGLFAVSFRNYDRTVMGTDRFIPVRSDDERIAMCMLEYAEAHVDVTDVLWERGDSEWAMTASSYRKLRLPVAWINECMAKAGFTIVHSEVSRGMVTMIGRAE